jgi:threonine synthase
MLPALPTGSTWTSGASPRKSTTSNAAVFWPSIRIGNPASWDLAVAARSESGGSFGAVTDEEILHAQRELAANDGVFVEPASAAGVAGMLKELGPGEPSARAAYGGRRIVVTVTGHGLKDIDTALSTFTDLVDTVVDADVDAAAEAAGL